MMATSHPQTKPLDFHRLEILLAQMAALVENNLGDTIAAFDRRDITQAQTIIAIDERIDALFQSIETGAYAILSDARFDLDQLRGLLTVTKIAAELERVGDLCKSSARRLILISEEKAVPQFPGVVRMGGASLRQLSDVLNAFAARDVAAAKAVWAGDDEVDELYHSVFRQILGTMQEDADRINGCTHVVFIAKNFERVADHATNIAKAIHFLIMGSSLEEHKELSSPPKMI